MSGAIPAFCSSFSPKTEEKATAAPEASGGYLRKFSAFLETWVTIVGDKRCHQSSYQYCHSEERGISAFKSPKKFFIIKNAKILAKANLDGCFLKTG